MKKVKFVQIVFAICLINLMTSCMTTRTSVGAYKDTPGSAYTYAKGKQIWLFWGAMPVGRTSLATPANGACQVITRFSLLDFIVSGITGGVVITETIKVIAKK